MLRKGQHKNFKRQKSNLTTEQKIEKFITRNSDNGFFTKISTIQHKFEISENMTWSIVGQLLVEGLLESTHDTVTGEMKLCKVGRTYSIMNLEQKRKRDRYRENKNTRSKRTTN